MFVSSPFKNKGQSCCGTVMFVILIISLLSSEVIGQNFRANKKRKDRPARNVARADGNVMFQALTINYPLDIFNSQNTRNWRTPGEYDSDFASQSQVGDYKPYSELSQAQDQEDIWLYENWFYGMKNGVIMESGALNGILFSTSFMFEKYANWTAIHVGESLFHFLYSRLNQIRVYLPFEIYSIGYINTY